MKKVKYEDLRSARWFARDDLRSFGHRSRMLQMGFAHEEFCGKPVIAIINPWNELNTCHSHFPQRVQDIKRGITAAGGFGVEVPVLSLGEQLMKPSAMLYRNLLALEVEEVLRAYPIDGAVLMGGCDKTTPGVLMGALVVNLPSIFVPAGPMLRGNYQGEVVGSGSDVWKYWDELRAGNIGEEQWRTLESSIARSAGICMTMGTAATMTALAEALGLSLPNASAIPAVDANHSRMAYHSGSLAVAQVMENRRLSDVLSAKSFDNAICVCNAIGASTNAIIHLLALARRAACTFDLQYFDKLASEIPLLTSVKPSGEYLMEDFYYAGGLSALMKQLSPKLHLDASSVNGKSLGENIKDAKVYRPEVISSLENPVNPSGATAVLTGNLAPDGAIIKPSALSEKFMRHQGPALVFESIADLKAQIDDDDLQVTADSVLVLKNAGPVGAPGMPEWGMLPIPKKLLASGVRDMLRISDARMSGTSYGACVLHVAPEAAVGGPLAIVQTGDIISLDVEARQLTLQLSDEEIERRLAVWRDTNSSHVRKLSAYSDMYIRHVTQANLGCDFDFAGDINQAIGEPDIY